MDTVDITPTPAAYRQIARLFRAQQDLSEETIARASRALDLLEDLDDDEIGPWDRALLAAAFDALGDSARVRVAHMRDGLDALGPYAGTDDEHAQHAQHEEMPHDAT